MPLKTKRDSDLTSRLSPFYIPCGCSLVVQELLMHDALADRSQVLYDPYTPEQQQGIRRQLEKFVAAQVSEMFLETIR